MKPLFHSNQASTLHRANRDKPNPRRCARFFLPHLLAVSLGLGRLMPSAQAGEAQVGVRAFAQDSSVGATGSQSTGTPSTGFATATASATYSAGLSSSFVYADANALTGAMHADFKAIVGADQYVVGRNANASGALSITGGITLSAGLPPGLATFSAVVEGGYNFNNAPTHYLNHVSLTYEAIIGDVVRGADLTFDPFTTAGIFAIPLSFTIPVQGGQPIFMSFSLRANIDALEGIVELDLMNSFKLTGISLPDGYTYTSDAQGFLSEFPFGGTVTPPPTTPTTPATPSAVPEPGTGVMIAAFVLLLIGARFWPRRARGTIAC